MHGKPTVLDDALVALFVSAVVLGHIIYFAVEGLPSLFWRV
jgi:hypothetical protein